MPPKTNTKASGTSATVIGLVVALVLIGVIVPSAIILLTLVFKGRRKVKKKYRENSLL